MHYDTRKEIRTLGTSHYQFSRDEETRAQEMARLKEARLDTIQQRDSAAQKKEARKRELEDRKRLILEKAAKRRRSGQETHESASAEAFLSSLE